MNLRLIFCWLFLAALPALGQSAGRILVVTADGADWIAGAGGTLAQLVLEGYEVTVAQFGNDEKESAGLSQPETRLANVQEAKASAEYLGVEDWVLLDHKSGELGYVSSTEMRKQLFGLIRFLEPKKIFIPDPYVHYQQDWDVWFTGLMAEEAWGYSGGAMFGPELQRIGLDPYSVPEIFYYAVSRPYRPREGGEQNARLEARDIGRTAEAKFRALTMLKTRYRRFAATTKARLESAGRSTKALPPFDEAAVQRLVHAWAEDLARAIGAKHGYEYGEEFNYVGPGPAIPPHALERAVKKEGER